MKVLISGDYCPQHRVSERFVAGDYSFVLGQIKAIADKVDYSIVNLECPVTKGDEKQIVKLGPRLQCSEKGIEAIRWAGFDCVTLANNHFLDYGEEGVQNTLTACEKYGLDTVGGGHNLKEASQILYKNIDGKKLSIINCCEHEFSIASELAAGSNPLNPIQQYYAIKEARKKADFVLVIVHGGNEHYQLPSSRMQETYRFFIDAGADAVVNHHQHCYSGYEIYKGKPIFYGLGNFCFDKGKPRNRKWHDGFMVILDLYNSSVDFHIIPYSQCEETPKVQVKERAYIEENLAKLNNIIVDSHQLKQSYEAYCKSMMANTSVMLEPISNRYIRGLQLRGLFPLYSFKKKHLLRLYNMIFCEAQKDKVKFFLENNKRCYQ